MRLKMVFFDLDGTLVTFSEAESSWDFIRKKYSIPNLWTQYVEGKMGREEAKRKEYALWKEKGITKQALLKEFERMRLIPGAIEVVSQLKKEGIKIAIISGAPDIAVEIAQRRLGISLAACNRIIFDNAGFAIDTKPTHPASDISVSKKLAALDFMKRGSLTPEECAAVGNDENDVELFQTVGFSIAFNPRAESLKSHSSVTVRSKTLQDILSYLLVSRQ